MEWLGRANIDFVHAPYTRTLTTKNGDSTDLAEICTKATPECHLNPLLFNGYLQTLWTATKPGGPPVYYRRRLFEAEDQRYQGSFAVDFAVPPFDESDPTLSRRTVYYTEEQLEDLDSGDRKPMLVVLHGLAGGSHEIYLRSAIAPLVEERKWEVCVVNSRGCARSKVTSGILFTAHSTWDLRQTVKWLRKTFPNRPLFGLGFSLGASVLTKYCGEEGPNCQLKAAVICANPFDFDVANTVLGSSIIGKEFFLRIMGAAMKDLLHKHKKDLQQHRELDWESIDKIQYLYDFDRIFQCPIWGYPNETVYYRDASSVDAISTIQIPFLAIQAMDDPVAVKEALPYEAFKQNPNTVMVTTSLGGHLCWFETGGGRWYPRPICNFLNYMAFEIDLSSASPLQNSNETPAHVSAGECSSI